MKRHKILWMCMCSAVPLIAASALAQETPVVPVIDPVVQAAAAKMAGDANMKNALADLQSAADAKYRFNTHMEIVRIASPSRYELRRAAEIHKRLVNEWGFKQEEVKTRADGNLPGAGVQLVDGLPVYNACVEIKGSYSGTQGAQSYKGQYPKVVIEGHIDTVNPAVLPPAETPYEPIKLQPIGQAIVTTPAELAAIPDELHFDANGRIIEDANYTKAYKRFDNSTAATGAGAYRIYVPGFSDAMGNTIGVLSIARMMKKHNIKPVYDMWICATAGEEGKGNLAGMKQLYGYNQDTGKGNNALNVVANFSIDGGSGTINYLGSYRFEMKYVQPPIAADGLAKTPSALNAAAYAVAKIADVKTPWDDDKTAERTTYTVGVAGCEEAPASGRSASCSIEVDMRSPTPPPLNAIRAKIEPLFQAGVTEENKRLGMADGSDKAVKLEKVWFGDRPAHTRTDLSPTLNDVAIQAAWQSAETVGVGQRTSLDLNSTSLNDNVPAAVGVPSINLNAHATAGGGGGHAFWEWGIPGNADREALSIYRIMMAGLIAAGYHAADGSVIQPFAGPMGGRTTEDTYN